MKNSEIDELKLMAEFAAHMHREFGPRLYSWFDRQVDVRVWKFWKRILGVSPKYWWRILYACDNSGINKARAVVLMRLYGHVYKTMPVSYLN